MAYRRRQGTLVRSSTFKEEVYHQHADIDNDNGNVNGSLAAIYPDSSASTSCSHFDSVSPRSPFPSLSISKGSFDSKSTLTKDANESSNYGLWGILAEKGKSILDGNDLEESPSRMKHQVADTTDKNQFSQSPHKHPEAGSMIDNAKLRKRFDVLTSPLNNLGDSFGNASEEGRSPVENKNPDIAHETRKLQIRRRGVSSDAQDQTIVVQNSSWQRPMIQTTVSNNQGTQLRASRDVAMATAAKAKVLLRELKGVKAELAFAKQRCAQLEEENKRLRQSREKGENPADDDDLIRLQLESLLAEKARLAHENALHARQNRFLREIVEYHRLKMQDLVNLEDGIEEVPEDYLSSVEDTKGLYSISSPTSPMSPMSPLFFQEVSSLFFPRTEVPKDEPNNVTCSPSFSKLSPLGFDSEGPTTLQRVEEEDEEVEEKEICSSMNLSNARDGDEKRPSFFIT